MSNRRKNLIIHTISSLLLLVITIINFIGFILGEVNGIFMLILSVILITVSIRTLKMAVKADEEGW